MLWDNNVEIETNPTGEAHGYLNRTAGGTTWYSESEKVVDMLISTVNDPTILWAGKENVVKTTTSTTTVTTSVTETSATSVTTTTVTSSSTQTTVTTQAGGSKVVEAELTKLDNGVSFKLNGADAVEVTISANSNGGGNGAFGKPAEGRPARGLPGKLSLRGGDAGGKPLYRGAVGDAV